MLQVYRVSDMELVKVLPSAEDEVNVACFHPSPGGGLAYGTKVHFLLFLGLNPHFLLPLVYSGLIPQKLKMRTSMCRENFVSCTCNKSKGEYEVYKFINFKPVLYCMHKSLGF
jgi:hypothetical protein